jgi:hypothetical protein
LINFDKKTFLPSLTVEEMQTYSLIPSMPALAGR